MWNHFYIEMIPHFLRKQLFSLGQNLVTSLDREMHPHFLRKQLFILCQNLVASLYRNDSTFLKNTMGGFIIAKCDFPVNVTYTE